ncbi:MAG: hypothetical protein D6820_17130 [Lentisphaerae bacterium]|nr:MAG: hypothetical protein D6820_17130 [Lentisphaerota bacterium]
MQRSWQKEAQPSKEWFLTHLPEKLNERPALIISADQWEKSKEAVSEPGLARLFLANLRDAGEKLLNAPPVEHRCIGRRMLDQSRECLRRILLWGSQAKLFPEESKWSERSVLELRQVCSLPDWHPQHFLDTAEMAAAVAIGLNWLADQMDPEEHRRCLQALYRHALKPVLDSSDAHGWRFRRNNWNQVCWGGMILAALEVGRIEPEPAARMLAEAMSHLHFGLEVYAPDGAYPEGPGYWEYGTSYTVLTISALRSVFGTDWGIAETPGLKESSFFVEQMTGPSGKFYSFSDGGSQRHIPSFPFWWLCVEAGREELLHREATWLKKALEAGQFRLVNRLQPLVLHLLRDVPAPRETLPSWHARGVVPLVTLRKMVPPDELYVAAKGGSPSHNHGHQDVGSFVLDWHGQRWVEDPGKVNYHQVESAGLNLWDSSQEGDRWKVLWTSLKAHSVLRVENQMQRVSERAEFDEFRADPPRAAIDLSRLYGFPFRRTFTIGEDDVFEVCDTLQSPAGQTLPVIWHFLTRCECRVTEAEHIMVLQASGAAMKVIAPQGVHWKCSPVIPEHEWEGDGDGLWDVCFTLAIEKQGEIKVRFEPVIPQ